MLKQIRDAQKEAQEEIRLLKENPHAFMLRQIRKLIEVGESGRLIPVDEFKAILKTYVETGERPKEE
jgi:hypothetical protein